MGSRNFLRVENANFSDLILFARVTRNYPVAYNNSEDLRKVVDNYLTSAKLARLYTDKGNYSSVPIVSYEP